MRQRASVRVLLACLAVGGCGPQDVARDAALDASVDAPFDAAIDTAVDTAMDAAPSPLTAAFDAPAYADLGETIVLDASASAAEHYRFELGDGRVIEGPEPHVTATWPAVGRFTVRLVVRRGPEEANARRLVTVTEPVTFAPRQRAAAGSASTPS